MTLAAASPELRFDFASDNALGLAPEALSALVAGNAGAVRAYGGDAITARAADAVRALLDADAEVRFVFSGTAANAIALSMLTRPYEAALAHLDAHVRCDEVGAPSFFGHGLHVSGLPGPHGKIDASALAEALAAGEAPQRPPPGSLSLTNATEYGGVYASAAFETLVSQAKSAGLGVHLDGARLANAVAAGFDPRVIAHSGVDLAVVGGAKAGGPCVEALVVFDRSLARRLDHRLKQAGQLASKARLMTAPFLALIESGAWARGGAQANAMARRLAAGFAERTPFALQHPVEANLVFVDVPQPAQARLQEQGWATFRAGDGSVRLVCSWETTEDMVDEILEAVVRAV